MKAYGIKVRDIRICCASCQRRKSNWNKACRHHRKTERQRAKQEAEQIALDNLAK